MCDPWGQYTDCTSGNQPDFLPSLRDVREEVGIKVFPTLKGRATVRPHPPRCHPVHSGQSAATDYHVPKGRADDRQAIHGLHSPTGSPVYTGVLRGRHEPRVRRTCAPSASPTSPAPPPRHLLQHHAHLADPIGKSRLQRPGLLLHQHHHARLPAVHPFSRPQHTGYRHPLQRALPEDRGYVLP